MDGEIVSAIGLLAAASGYFMRGFLQWRESKQVNKRSGNGNSGSNGKSYLTTEQLKEHCAIHAQNLGLQVEEIRHDISEQKVETRELTKAIYAWKDEAVKVLADHGARISAVERRAHGR